MELLTAGQRTSDLAGFSQLVSPFPDPDGFSGLVHFEGNTEMIAQRPNIPPQKLRPIRFSGRSSGSPLSDSCFSLLHFEKGEMEDSLGKLVGELRSDDNFNSSMKLEAGNGGEHCLVQARSSVGVVNSFDDTCEEGLLEDEIGSSADDDESPESIVESTTRKRKRKTRVNMKQLVKNLVTKVMEKQEMMHNQFIKMFEMRERERILREEAWKQQEVERRKIDQEARNHEIARNVALISFIQDILGHEIQIPQLSTIPQPEEVNAKVCQDFSVDSSSRRWLDTEVQSLITLRVTLEHKFSVTGSKCSNIWNEIAIGMCNMGYYRTARKCKEKWENINKYFRRSVGSGKKALENCKACPYFNELEMLYRNRTATQTYPTTIQEQAQTSTGQEHQDYMKEH